MLVPLRPLGQQSRHIVGGRHGLPIDNAELLAALYTGLSTAERHLGIIRHNKNTPHDRFQLRFAHGYVEAMREDTRCKTRQVTRSYRFRLLRVREVEMGAGLKSRKTSWTRRVFVISGLGISLSMMASCGGSSMTQHQLIAIVVSPTGAGASQGDTVPFTATGTFAQPPTTQTNIPAQWTSSDTTTATINPSTGAATCVGIGGPITVTASAAGIAGTLQSTGELTCAAPGTGPVKLVPNSLDFGCELDLTGSCSCSPPETTTLTNSLSTSLTIDSITVDGAAFSESNNCGTSVGPGQSCTITVSWSPKTIPDTGGPVTISDSDSTSPQTVSLPVFKHCNP
jgi:hypothetical protein